MPRGPLESRHHASLKTPEPAASAFRHAEMTFVCSLPVTGRDGTVGRSRPAAPRAGSWPVSAMDRGETCVLYGEHRVGRLPMVSDGPYGIDKSASAQRLCRPPQ